MLVSGVSVTLAPFAVPQSAKIWGINASLIFEIHVMRLVMSILSLYALWKGKLSRIQGFILLAIYVVFCAVQFTL